MRNVTWTGVLIVLIGGTVWLEAFLQWPLESVLVLLVVGGWWDYQRRRSKLKPPWT